MKEHGILMSEPMIHGLRRDVDPKTQTRRIAKFDADPGLNLGFSGLSVHRFGRTWRLMSRSASMWEERSKPLKSRYGLEGDRLYCKETWQADPPIDDTWASTAWHGCPKDAPLSEIPERFRHPAHCLYRATWLHGKIRWRPSLFMPRWASRILLEITDIRIERLQAISDDDAIAEGIERIKDGWRDYMDPNGLCMRPRTSYLTLWDSINGAGSHHDNPFVFVIVFKQVQP